MVALSGRILTQVKVASPRFMVRNYRPIPLVVLDTFGPTLDNISQREK
jgi:hypothetical protein